MIRFSQKLGPTSVLLLLAIVAYSLTLWADRARVVAPTAWHDAKIEAASTMEQARELLVAHGPIVGESTSPITTLDADPQTKRSVWNPNVAAFVVEQLTQAGVRRGDKIAVGLSGSYPGMNVALLAACNALEVEPIIITSVAASAYGANDPDFHWLEMERRLHDAALVPVRSVAASMGGADDRARGLLPAGRDLLREAIARSDVPAIVERDLESSIRRRYDLYASFVREDLNGYQLYINIGGGLASLGQPGAGDTIATGLVPSLQIEGYAQPGVAHWFAEHNVPVLNLLNMPQLFRDVALDSPIGAGPLYVSERHDLRVVVFSLVLMALLLTLAYRAHRASRRRKEQELYEPMGGERTSNPQMDDTHVA